MQKKYIALGILATFLIGLSLVHVLTLDGLSGLFWDLICEENTEYTQEYSNSTYRKVRKGMTKTEVVALVGQPFYTNNDFKTKESEERWWYSKHRSPSGGDYRMREVRFLNDVVSRKVHYFYVD